MNNISQNAPSKIDLEFAEYKIVFTISDCSLNKNFSFYKLNRTDAKKFIKRLKYLEEMSWGKFSALDRRDGLTAENFGSDNFDLIQAQDSSFDKIVEQHYFHFRVEKNNLFRIFGYQKKQFFCITQIDPRGKINH